MAAQKRRSKAGDILRVTVEGGAVYLQYLGKHPEYGDTIRVLPGDSLQESPKEFATTGYVAFYPVTASVAQGLVAVVGHRNTNLSIPPKLRRPGARGKDGTVLAWIIEEDGREWLTKGLSADERALPIAVIWNHEMLCTRLRDGWRPDREE